MVACEIDLIGYLARCDGMGFLGVVIMSANILALIVTSSNVLRMDLPLNNFCFFVLLAYSHIRIALYQR